MYSISLISNVEMVVGETCVSEGMSSECLKGL